MNDKPGWPKRIVAYALIACLVSEPALGAATDVATTPLGFNTSTRVLPNLLFTLDDSGSMDWDYLPDYVNDGNPCMETDSGGTTCGLGDPPFMAGGPNGFNGVAYDPQTNYLPGLTSTGAPVLTPPLNTTSLEPDAYLGGTNVNLTSGIRDKIFCNSSSTPACKRNGASNTGFNGATTSGVVTPAGALDPEGNTLGAGQFPYRANVSSASTISFGLPEMMTVASFARSGTTVTATTQGKPALTTSDRVWVNSSGSSLDVTCVPVTSVSANSFTYTTSGSGTVSAQNGDYRKCDTGTWSRSSGGSTITVTRSGGHQLVSNDRLIIDSDNNSQDKTSEVAITVTGATTFTYTGANSGTTSGNVAWVRTGLYNEPSNSNGSAISYYITPTEYCSDVGLTNCVEVIPPAAPPAGFTFPAYVRFCQTQAQAFAPGGVGDASGTPRCRAKYVNAAGLTQYEYPRYGRFNRDTITSLVTSYGNRPARTDCLGAPTCTYDEEIQNYARWYTYYRKRMMMMKTAAGRTFLPFIGNPSAVPPKPTTLRVGFITIDPGSPVSSSKYLRILDFDTAHAANFYTKFYDTDASGFTPLLPALSRAGWVFAGKLNTGLTSGIPTSHDPMQASCQKNFSILTTDGYWNSGSGQTITGGAIGNQDNQDNQVIAPYTEFMVDRTTTGTLDGIGTQVTTVTPTSTVVEQNVCIGSNNTTFGTGTNTGCGCSSGQQRIKQRSIATGTTVVTVDGVNQSSTPGTTTTFTDITVPCAAAVVTTQTIQQTALEHNVCSRDNNTTFSGSAEAECDCGGTFFNPERRIRSRTQNQTRTIVTTNGVVTSDNTVVNGASVFGYVTACATGAAPTITLNPNPTVTVNSSSSNTTGTALTAAAPQTVLGGAPTSTTVNGGVADTLADVALYYFKTDLRNAGAGPLTSPNTTPANGDVATNNVPTKKGEKDFPTHQHMVTFTLGMADGLMRYQSDYDTATSGDFVSIKNGTVGGCYWTPGTCNWPPAAEDTPMALDDLWHAAVNGRGRYYQALNASALSLGLQQALTAINTQVAAAAASATSSPNVTQSDNQIFSTTYETNTWSGKVFAQTIDPVTAEVSAAIQWEADVLLLNRVTPNSDTRNILTFDPAGAGKVKSFAWGTLSGAQQAFFSNKCTPLGTMSQCALLAPAQLANANDGSRLVGYLRGWQQDEGTAFRDRIFTDPATGVAAQTVLGDTVDSKPAFVRNPTFSYNDVVTPSYSTFSAANANRAPRVYVGANDGYLHAFDGNTGAEAWAYLPSFLMPGLYSLADHNYATQHRFFVDGSPEVGDVFDSGTSAWKTILVSGTAAGGRGFFALDVTDPATPKALWEFCSDATLCANSDTDLGLSFGNPVIGKRSYDGKWVVVLTSGLNNTSPGSGIGHFYVLDALTGTVLSKVATTQGTVTTPSGLMKISAFYDSPLTDATFSYVYGGDQLGHLWRLNVSTAIPTVLHLARLVDGSSPARGQPITTRPTLTHIGANPVLYIGTGRYLGHSDLTDPGAPSGIAWQQTMYGLMDKNIDYGNNIRTGANLAVQTLTKTSATERGITGTEPDWNVHDGWRVDFNPAADPTPGERVNIDPRLVLGTVVVITNTPSVVGSCDIAGSSRLYAFDFRTGLALSTSPNGVVGVSLGGALAVGGAIVQTSTGAIKDIITLLPGTKSPSDVPPPALAGTLKRFGYRVR